MSTPAFIAGDWGTTHLRLTLCDGAGNVLEAASGPGVSAVRSRVEETFFALTKNWADTYGALPVVLCGMAGSTIGWREVPYLPAPRALEKIFSGALRFESRADRPSPSRRASPAATALSDPM